MTVHFRILTCDFKTSILTVFRFILFARILPAQIDPFFQGIYIDDMYIILAKNTQQLLIKSQPEKSPLRIEVQILKMNKETLNMETGLLFFKHQTDTSYISLNLIQGANSLWYADIPGEKVVYPTVEFYITLTRKGEHLSMPPSSPSIYPFRVPVGTNSPPFIQYKKIPYAFAGTEITFKLSAIDTTESINSVCLYYRTPPDSIYNKNNMLPISDDHYETIIPAEDVIAEGLEYYILAFDNYHIFSYQGTAQHPIFLKVNNFVIQPENVKPSPFTPNDDGFNDYVFFNFPELAYGEGKIEIYNFQGKRIEVIQNDYRWNGKDKNGNNQPAGTYIYLVSINGKVISNGTVTLVR